MRSKLLLIVLGLTLIAGAERTAQATGSTSRLTTIVVKDMHCAACAKKIAGRLYTVSGVVEVRADVKRNLAYVGPQKSKDPSPRALWEAVEAAGFHPVQLIGPTGRFTSKPKN